MYTVAIFMLLSLLFPNSLILRNVIADFFLVCVAFVISNLVVFKIPITKYCIYNLCTLSLSFFALLLIECTCVVPKMLNIPNYVYHSCRNFYLLYNFYCYLQLCSFCGVV